VICCSEYSQIRMMTDQRHLAFLGLSDVFTDTPSSSAAYLIVRYAASFST